MLPARASGLLVDRLSWDRRAAAVSFSVDAGERVYLCGEGADSLLLALAGFLPALSGRVLCEGRELTSIPATFRHVAYIPGGNSLIGRRSLLANVALPGAGRAAGALALSRLGLTQRSHRVVEDLPAADRRLGALARALAHEPALLLVQEARDDPPAIPDRLAILDRPPAVIATYSAPLALARARRIVLLQDGRAVQVGSPRDIYERPADGFAATWPGACNLIPATLAGPGPTAGSLLANVGGHVMPVRFRDRTTGPVRLAVRPHRLRLDTAGLPAVVRGVDFQGASTRIALALGDTELLLDVADADLTLGQLAPGRVAHVAWHWSDAWPVPP